MTPSALTGLPVPNSGRRLRRGAGIGVASAVAACGALLLGGIAAAAAPVPAQASGESYLVGGTVTVATAAPVFIGPVEPAAAYVPGNNGANDVSIVTCGPTPACADPVISNAQAVQDTAKATLTQSPTTSCTAASSPPLDNGQLTGANACSSAAKVGVLNLGLPALLPIDVGAVQVQSLTQSCTTAPAAHFNLASLKIGVAGTNIVPAGVVAPNTKIALPAPLVGVTVILNEQTFDSSGHGLTVNAAHIFIGGALAPVATADIIVGHTHSQAFCDTGTTDTGPGSGGGLQSGTKTDGSPSVVQGGSQTYNLSINHGNPACLITTVVDTLPPGFTYMAGSATGDLGTPTTGVAPVTAQVTLTFFNRAGFPATPDPLTETIGANVSATLAPGQYVNNVTTLSSCGQVNLSDNPGTIVTAAPTGSPTPTPTQTSPPATNPPGGPGGPPVPPTGQGGTSSWGVLLLSAGLAVTTTGLVLRRHLRTSSLG